MKKVQAYTELICRVLSKRNEFKALWDTPPLPMYEKKALAGGQLLDMTTTNPTLHFV